MHKKPSFLNAILLLLFAALSYVGIMHHELWLDEANDWLMAGDSNSFAEMLHNARYSGHPALWISLLFILSRITHEPLAMQLLHCGISIIGTYLFIRYSSFPFLFKFCTIFSYFVFFEYGIISRSYNITWLLLVIFCIVFCRERRNYFLLTLTLILLANTHAFSLIIAFALFGITLYTYRQEKAHSNRHIMIFCVLFIIGAAISVLTILPPTDAHIIQQSAGNYFSADRFSKTLSIFVKGLLPFPNVTSSHFWNSNFIVSNFKLIGILLTPFLFIIPLILFYNKPIPLITFYVSAFLIILMIFKLNLFTGVHYMGYIFMLLIISLWLASDTRLASKSLLPETWNATLSKLKTICYHPFIGGILACQFAAGMYAFCMDYSQPFSEGKETASYIKTIISDNSLLIAAPFYAGPSIAVYTDKKFFYPDENRLCTFTPCNTYPIDANETWKRIIHLIDTSSSKQIIMALAFTGDTLKTLQQGICALDARYTLKNRKEFNKGIVGGENYEVYIIEK
jgi:hypothetical protein